MNYPLIRRLSDVVARLDRQVLSGTKNTKEGPQPLTAKDRERITRERATLINRIETLKSL